VNKTIITIALLAISIVGLSVTGCVSRDIDEPDLQPAGVTDKDFTVMEEPAETLPLTNIPPKNRTWISPGKVEVGNYYAGATADWYIQVHNGKPTPVVFKIVSRPADYNAEGYSNAQAQDWIIISDATPILAAYETKKIKVSLQIPSGTKNIPAKWEYWISAIDQSQTGNVTTELCSRWLITMR
jgi:hypothetical protein